MLNDAVIQLCWAPVWISTILIMIGFDISQGSNGNLTKMGRTFIVDEMYNQISPYQM